MAALDQGLARPLTLVSAPAGAGKSMLLAEWMDAGAATGPVAYVPLGRDADDRRGFWSQVTAAARSASPELTALEVPPRGPLDGFVSAFMGLLADWVEPLVLILDDLHAVRAPAVMDDLEGLLESQPTGLRLAISTRTDPPLRLERLRLAGMVEIRAADLAFTLPETGDLLAAVGLSDAALELLWRHTEGWVAGLRLAELSIARSADPHAFVAGFAGDGHAVSDYLMSEVVSHQPAELLDFMLRTAIVDEVNGELADAMTGGRDGDSILHDIERRDGLATAVERAPGWYRYHPLLIHVLRAESARRLRAEQPELHRRAGRWHAAHGVPVVAVHHAVEAGDYELAASVLGEHWLVLVTRGSGTALRRLVERIPDEVVSGDAELALARAGLELEAGADARADELMLEAQRLAPELGERRRRRFAVTSTATTLQRARLRGDTAEALSAARVVLQENWDPELAAEIRAHTLANLGIAELWAGDLEAAGHHLQQAAGLALECDNDFVLFLAESYAGGVDVTAGRSNEAWTRAHTAVQLAERRGWTELPHAAVAYCTLATVHLWRNERREAEPLVDRAVAVVAGANEPLLSAAAAQLRAWLMGLRGEPLSALDLVRVVASQEPLPLFLRVSAGIHEAELWLTLGEPARARGRLSELASEPAPDAFLGLARLELAGGDPGAALRELANFFGDERQPVLPFVRVEAWVIDAIARDAIRDEEGALRALERALDMVEPRGCPSVVSRYGAPVRSLLRRLVARGTRHRALAGELLAALDDTPAAARFAGAALLEPLSERELTVLRFLPTMMSNAEIAAEMFVSVNTVKTHLKHVYRKLDVTDRRDCVRRGRELRLLSPGLGDV